MKEKAPEEGAWKRELVGTFKRIMLATSALFEHLVIAFVIIAASYLIELLVELLHHGPWLLLGRVPGSYLFDIFDAAVLIVLGYRGMLHFNEVLKGS